MYMHVIFFACIYLHTHTYTYTCYMCVFNRRNIMSFATSEQKLQVETVWRNNMSQEIIVAKRCQPDLAI